VQRAVILYGLPPTFTADATLCLAVLVALVDCLEIVTVGIENFAA
jgi:hypothetical protein